MPRPSYNQQIALIEFLERNPSVAKGRVATSTAKAENKIKWARVANSINALGEAKKDGLGWAKYWTEKKCGLKKVWASRSKDTGDLSPFSELDLRYLKVIGDRCKYIDPEFDTQRDSMNTSEEERTDELEPDSDLWNYFTKDGEKLKCTLCEVSFRNVRKLLYGHWTRQHSDENQCSSDKNYTDSFCMENELDKKTKYEFDDSNDYQKDYNVEFDTEEIINDQNQIDNFAKYIASLLKNVPKSALNRVQNNIVSIIMDAQKENVDESNVNVKNDNDINDDNIMEEHEDEEKEPSAPEKYMRIEETTSNTARKKRKKPQKRVIDESEEKVTEHFGKYVSSLLGTISDRELAINLQKVIVNLILDVAINKTFLRIRCINR